MLTDKQILAIPNFNSNTISLINLGLQASAVFEYVTPLYNSIDLQDSLRIDWEDVTGGNRI